MKIALVVDALSTGGGVEGYLRRAAEFLGSCGDEVELVVGRGAPEGPWRLRALESGGLGAAARLRAFAAAHAALARTARWDTSLAVRHVRFAHVLQPHGGLVEAAARARDERRTSAVRVALRRTYRRLSPRARTMRALEAEAMSRSHVVLALSEAVRAEIATWHPHALARTELLPLGVDLARFTMAGSHIDWTRELGIPAGAPIVLFVAFNAALKGFAEAARALLAEDGLAATHLVVAGPPRPPALPREARALLAHRLHWLPPRNDLPALYRSAAALLHPTWYDPCSTVALEALACGCPVVTTRRNGAAEIASEALIAVDSPRDAAALARGLSHLLARGAILRTAARASAEGRSEREHFARLRAVLERAAGAPSSP